MKIFHKLEKRLDRMEESLERIERHTHYLIRSVTQMAINEQEFNQALADFATTLDETLATIQSKLDGMGAGSDFTEELEMLNQAKTRLTDFVASNTTETPETEPTEDDEPHPDQTLPGDLAS